MCGRYSLEARPEEIAEAFALAEAIAFAPRYNVAPTQIVPVIRPAPKTGKRVLDLIRWGLTPGKRSLINARADTVASKPTFRKAFQSRRCLVPATGFYEWQKLGDAKQPFYIRPFAGDIFAFAGIWDQAKDKDGKSVDAFAILTTQPNELMTPIHDRMPVIIEPAAYKTWLNPDESSDALKELLHPAPEGRLTAFPISTHVNNPDNDDAACIKPLAAKPANGFDEELFA